ncbi:MAG: hypothetical protein UU81_C0031G0014 [Microgenomates group bacterium GW2011_GWC1_41_8]|uniref:Uncharacterized protein n=2 Tax=Candidatus Roizmaniibacteriota TaxID=1752723 RepID=A0A0G0T372_9BACT|nr:MAG: hypothetical protein UU14_C0027G0003 [Candidatus Roizmanbacteria bacterium GW2011_GWB1_40_7]KKR93290.1 MAG: hypothetical protein UU41_C0021G0003 [Candidatus Roizmanbacteria bacterium GW2011_GWA1_41_13]KKS23370.1 MAG: hypothetical protein UU81_C0031G0014 [Microgenomates group bacterium GW2011_GWC1_41_8]OGK47742.1 MAG: hypothetical protein A3A55_02195 [Candidatus Roizmanbacteria bacterium RIFCSPLOWO2_01_FULL_40_14]
MKQKKHETHLSYLYLAILGLLSAFALETLSSKVNFLLLPELTHNITVSLLYVISGIMFTAFIASSKLVNDQKYILYLVALALVFFRVFSLTGGMM